MDKPPIQETLQLLWVILDKNLQIWYHVYRIYPIKGVYSEKVYDFFL